MDVPTNKDNTLEATFAGDELAKAIVEEVIAEPTTKEKEEKDTKEEKEAVGGASIADEQVKEKAVPLGEELIEAVVAEPISKSAQDGQKEEEKEPALQVVTQEAEENVEQAIPVMAKAEIVQAPTVAAKADATLHKASKEPDPYRYNAPYPSISGVVKNSAYAKIIQESFSSPISEYTAASQYVFDHMVSSPQSKEVSKAFEGIAIVEMGHLEMLGKLILELGAIPFYKGDWRAKFWQGNFVKYNTNLRTMILCAISDEKKAISQYEKSIRMIKDPKIIRLLERIILDEEVHIEIFKQLLKKL